MGYAARNNPNVKLVKSGELKPKVKPKMKLLNPNQLVEFLIANQSIKPKKK